jgi:small subunit ribosomal protein S6e
LKKENKPNQNLYKPILSPSPMAFKINIGTKEGKTYKLEAEAESLIDKELHSIVKGEEIREDLGGYEFEIAGASDKSGFPAKKDVKGFGIKKVLVTYGFGMHRRPKREGKKKQSNPKPKGLRLRKTFRGNTISPAISQINLKVTKVGKKTLKDIFEPKAEQSPEAQ